MKKALGLVGAFLLFMLAVFTAVAIKPPVELAKRLTVWGTKYWTGFELQANGPSSLSLVPRISLRMEGVVVTNPRETTGKPILAARVVEVNAGLLKAIGYSHTIEQITLTDPQLELLTDKEGRHSWITSTLEPGAAPARSSGPKTFQIANLEVKGGNVTYADQRNGLATRLVRTDATLTNVTLDGLGEAIVKAGAAVLTDPASGANVEVSELVANARAVSSTRVDTMSASGAMLRWRDNSQPAAIEAATFAANAQMLGFDGIGPVTFSSATLAWPNAPGGGSLDAGAIDASAKSLRGGRLEDVAFKSGSLRFVHPSGTILGATAVAGSAKSARSDTLTISDLALNGGTVALTHPTGGALSARNLTARVKSATPARLEDVAAESAALQYASGPSNRAGSAAAPAPPSDILQQVSVSTPVLAFGAPVDAAVAFVHNNDRVAGTVKLPSPESLAAGPVIPANLSLKASRGAIDFDGRIDTSSTASLKGTTRVVTTSVEALAGWLGVTLPATLKGPVNLAGILDAQGSRIALSNGRIEHGPNTMNGTFAVDLGGARPKVSGKIVADKLDADPYIGMQPVAPKPSAQQPKPQGAKPQVIEPEASLGDIFKEQVRAMLDAPPKRGGALEIPELSADQLIPPARRAKPRPGGFTWSEEKFDLSALRAVDLDIDWSVKQLAVRGMQLNVPQLKTVLDAGTLTLEGRDLGTKDGKISGKAEIDAREAVPAITATLNGEGVDVYALSAAFGITPMIDGNAEVTANVRSRGSSQKQLVEQLSGNVRTNMSQGQVVGYDLGSINIFTLPKLLFGVRLYDPDDRTPISGLKADLNIDKGVVRESQVTVGGPLLGVNAEGTIGLIEQRLDYSGRARISTLFDFSFRYFGDWARATFLPSLGGANRSRQPGQPSLADIISATDIKEDAELALLIGRVLQKEGAGGLDQDTAAVLRAVQKKALGSK